jgi:hypothetical protein
MGRRNFFTSIDSDDASRISCWYDIERSISHNRRERLDTLADEEIVIEGGGRKG